MQKLAIVGIFFDGYYDLWEDFLELFETNWGDCPYPIYIVNNEKELKFDKQYKVQVIHAGKNAEYSRKVQKALESIDAEYYLLLLEDFFIGEKLIKDPIASILKYIEKNEIKYFRMPLGEFTPKKFVGKIVKMNPKLEYTISCQPSIWKREFLIDCIGTDNYNAWIFEGIYSKSKVAHTEEFLGGCVIDYRNLLGLYHGALQGKLLNATYKHFCNRGYCFRSNRKIISKKDEFKHKCKSRLKELFPISVQKKVKKLVNTNSVIGKYTIEIDKLVKKMEL